MVKTKEKISNKVGTQRNKDSIVSSTQLVYNLQLLKDIFIKNTHRKRYLKKFPWYLVIGHEKSGKTTAIKNSGLLFSKQEQINYSALTEQQAALINSLSFLFHTNAVIVDIKKLFSINTQHFENNTTWPAIQLLLKKHRKPKAINGIIFTCNIYEYLIESNKNAYHRNIKLTFEELHKQFLMPIPVYFIFTHCDLVAGFIEFFYKLDKKQQEQVWGITFPINSPQDAISLVNTFKNSYQQLLEHLQSQLLWLLEREQNKDSACLITCFPAQFQLFYEFFEKLLIEVFSIDQTYREPATQLRGMYFCSAMQQGETYDFQLVEMTKQLHLEATPYHKQLSQKNSFFLKDLFTKVIFPEANWIGETRLSQRRRLIIRRSSYLAMPLIVFFGIWSIINGYWQNKKDLAVMEVKLQNYQQTAKQLSDKDSILSDTLPTLNAFQEVMDIYQTTAYKWLVYPFFYDPWLINHTIYTAMQRLLTDIFMPRIALCLQVLLNDDSETNDLLYNQLKSYLIFNSSNINKSKWLKNTMSYYFNHTFSSQPLIQDQLHYYLNLMLQNTIPKFSLNQLLIAKVRQRLTATLPAERAYNLLIQTTTNSDISIIDFFAQLGAPFNNVFTIGRKISSIPAIYTILGYKKLYLPNFMDAINQVIDNNWILGIDKVQSLEAKTDMIVQLSILYGDNYLHSWENLLNNLQIIKFKNLTQAVNILNLLTSDQSPISSILNTVSKNTATIIIKHINISEQFTTLNTVTAKKDQQKILQNMQSDFLQLSNYLNSINGSTDISQAEFQAALVYLQDTTGKDPLHQLQMLAEQAPTPINNWLNEIVSNSLALLFAGAQQVIDNTWQQNVLPTYQSNLQNRYPFNPDTNNEVSLDDFSHYFATNDILDRFFQQYLKAFVNTDSQPWSWYVSLGQKINLDNKILQLFSHAAEIRDLYLPNAAQQINFSFDVQPLTLDSQSASVILELGNQQLSYQHGPNLQDFWQWPIADNIQQTKITFTDFLGNNYSSTFSGPRAWFKLLANGNLQFGNIPNSFILTLLIDGHQASFLLSSNKNIEFFDLKLLRNFQLPNTLQ